jgi:hypothetical protein
MNKTGTGHSILYNVMAIIEKLDDQEVADFATFATTKRKKAKYHALFRHLIDKSKEGVTKEEIDAADVKRWAKGKGAYADLIENLYDKLLEFLGKQYAASAEATWYRHVNQLMDQAEALYKKGLRDHAKIALDQVTTIWEAKEEKNTYNWDATIARIALLRQKFAQGQRTDTIVWTEEMTVLADQLSHWSQFRVRKVSDVPPTEHELNREWRSETILLRLMQLHAQYFRDKKGELDGIRQSLNKPSGAALRSIALRRGIPVTEEQIASAQETALNGIESLFMRIYGYHRAVELGDDQSANDFLNFGNHYHYSGKHFYPAASMWVLLQFQSMRLAHHFKYGKVAEGATAKQAMNQFQTEMEKEFADLPLRLEVYQILIQCGNCQFGTALQMIQQLIETKKTKNAALGSLKMLELLALWETNDNDGWKKQEALPGFLSHKPGEEWVFPKAFAAFMLKAPRLDNETYRVANDMKKLQPEVAKLKEKARPYDPIHQLILWRIHGWESGEANRISRPLGLNFI